MRKSIALAVLLLAGTGTAMAQDYPTVETSPAFMYIRTASPLNGSNNFNCVGGGGTFAYNFTSLLGVAADLGGCKVLQENNSILGSKVDGNVFTFLFGPRLTYRGERFSPFGELNFGGARIKLSCTSSAVICNIVTNGNSYTKTAFAMTVGGGLDFKLNDRFAIRLVQAEYLYTRFGNSCPLPVCNGNNSQNSFRLKSGLVIAWGGSASK